MTGRASRVTEPCPIERCPRRKSRDYLMCRPHWMKVPPELRDAVYAAVRAWRAAVRGHDLGVATLRGKELRAVQAEAIEAASS